MPSTHKKNKQVNSYQYKSCLKHKGVGIKRLSFYTSSERKNLNRKAKEESGQE